MIVVYVGSQTYGNEESFEKLVTRFEPELLYAFDPLARNESWIRRRDYGALAYSQIAAAAWVRDGFCEFGIGADPGVNATLVRAKNLVGEWSETVMVPCFDFSAWLSGFAEPVVVKMDIEGAEYAILEKMIADGTDARLSLLLVEWHDHKLEGDSELWEACRLAILENLRCEVESW